LLQASSAAAWIAEAAQALADQQGIAAFTAHRLEPATLSESSQAFASTAALLEAIASASDYSNGRLPFRVDPRYLARDYARDTAAERAGSYSAAASQRDTTANRTGSFEAQRTARDFTAGN
jgi:hypothetical protein